MCYAVRGRMMERKCIREGEKDGEKVYKRGGERYSVREKIE